MNKIQNFDELATSEARKIALRIAEAGLQAIDTHVVLKNLVDMSDNTLTIGKEKFSLENTKKIIFGWAVSEKLK